MRRVGLALLAALLVSMRPIAAQQMVDRARQLYESADFAGALKALDDASAEPATPEEHQTAREYRALCLLALNRTTEAEKTLEEMVEADPFYRPSTDHMPRRLVSTFDQVRRRVLPEIVREKYAAAVRELDAKQYAQSASGFEQVLRLVDALNASSDGTHDQPSQAFADLGTLAAKYLEASRSAQNPIVQAEEPKVYRSSDAGVTPAVPIQQELPPWQPSGADTSRLQGEIEVLIDTNGEVQDAQILASIQPAYDQAILVAAKKWTYRPATKDGQPVLFRKSIIVSLTPQRKKSDPATRRK